ncbi:MAG TPA: hypothetical protein VHV29_06850 [Terriglobales bacterium]|jgi:hypothetical protein|nr:hypothetical protein [Terriglobales bacterium]
MLKRHGGFVFDDSQFPKPGDADFIPTTEDDFWLHGSLMQQKRQHTVERQPYSSKPVKFSERCRRLSKASGKLDKSLDRNPDYY